MGHFAFLIPIYLNYILQNHIAQSLLEEWGPFFRDVMYVTIFIMVSGLACYVRLLVTILITLQLNLFVIYYF